MRQSNGGLQLRYWQASYLCPGCTCVRSVGSLCLPPSTVPATLCKGKGGRERKRTVKATGFFGRVATRRVRSVVLGLNPIPKFSAFGDGEVSSHTYTECGFIVGKAYDPPEPPLVSSLSLRWLGVSLKPLLLGKTISLRIQQVCNFGIQFYSVSEQIWLLTRSVWDIELTFYRHLLPSLQRVMIAKLVDEN